MEPFPARDAPMEKSATLKAKDLAPAAREWIMSVLHIDVTDDDEFTLSVHRPLHVPTPEQRIAARTNLFAVLDRIAERTKDVPEAEIAAAIGEAMTHIRTQPR